MPRHLELDRFLDAHDLAPEARAALHRVVDGMLADVVARLVGETQARQILPQVLPGSASLVDPPEMPDTGPDHGRYALQEIIGIGGMAEVWRAWDRVLERPVALKLLRPDRSHDPVLLRRFTREAIATAGLQHPGIVPVHDLGQLPDGRWFFAMAELHGHTLAELIAEQGGAPPRGPAPLRRMVGRVVRTCEAVAYAHARGMLHRDLKPANIIVGDFGQVVVLDWGLVKVDEEVDRETIAGGKPAGVGLTLAGGVGGTPAYMPPEQARGGPVDHRADVYALGAILYEVLCGRPPYSGATAADVLTAVLDGPPAPLPPSTPIELVQICEQAMERAPDDRVSSAKTLADRLRDWLEGAARDERARQLLQRAGRQRPRAREASQRARRLAARAAGILDATADHDPVEKRIEGWRLEDRAEETRRAAEVADLEQEWLLQAAHATAPDLPEAAEALADLYRERAEATTDPKARRRHLWLLERYDRGRHADWLRGDGALTLHTDPPGATVELCRYTLRDRRLVPEPVSELGPTPLDRVPLAMGSYLLRIRAPGRATVRYPVRIDRKEHWDGVPPGGDAPLPVYLPRSDELGPDDIHVPAGWARLGGEAVQALPARRVWVDGFIIRRFPVTHAEYLEFLNALVADGRLDQAWEHVPRERAARHGERGAPCYGFDERGGRFHLVADAEGDVWQSDWPVFMVSHRNATAFCTWRSTVDGLPWRLPTEDQWEKAGRGVDGRIFPWGEQPEPQWCRVRTSLPSPYPASVFDVPEDDSPYGVRGLAGNVREWCQDRADGGVGAQNEAQRVLKGGAWFFTIAGARLPIRYTLGERNRGDTIGFRLSRPLPRAAPTIGSEQD